MLWLGLFLEIVFTIFDVFYPIMTRFQTNTIYILTMENNWTITFFCFDINLSFHHYVLLNNNAEVILH